MIQHAAVRNIHRADLFSWTEADSGSSEIQNKTPPVDGTVGFTDSLGETVKPSGKPCQTFNSLSDTEQCLYCIFVWVGISCPRVRRQRQAAPISRNFLLCSCGKSVKKKKKSKRCFCWRADITEDTQQPAWWCHLVHRLRGWTSPFLQ